MNLKTLALLAILLGLFGSCTLKKEEEKGMAIMAYYVPPSENYKPQDLPLDKLTHIIFSFTEVLNNEMQFKNPSFPEKLHLLADQKKNHPHLKVMIACGGWGGSGGFSDMAATPDTRRKFVTSVIKFLKDYNLDGLDIDWEYPGMRGAGNPNRPEDKENFTSLMRELREAMDATGQELTLTFASAGWEPYYNHIEVNEVMKYADYMNIMTYDLVGNGCPVTAHHTNLGRITADKLKGTAFEEIIENEKNYNEPNSAEKIVSYCLHKGVNPNQMIIGGAFYGRAWKGVPPKNNGLYQPNKGVWIGWAPYEKIREKYENKNGFKRHWDSIAKAPYLYNPTDSLFITYDDTLSMKLKTRYVKEKELGGIMFWQLRLDTPKDGLVDAIYKEANK